MPPAPARIAGPLGAVGGTLFALRKLNDKGLLSNRDYAALTGAYEFLRVVEHRIQMEAGQQTHRLPTDLRALDRLGRRTGVETGKGERPGDVLLRRVREAFAVVDGIYQHVIHPAEPGTSGMAFELKPAPTLPPDAGRQTFESLLGFLDAQAPEVAGVVREADLSESGKRNATRLLAAVATTPERFAPARTKPLALRRAIEASGASAYLTELLVHHPEDLEVLDGVALGSADGDSSEQLEMCLPAFSLPGAYAWASEPRLDLREKMATLRRQYRARVLELATMDLAAGGSAFPMLRRWSLSAARCIASAQVIALTSSMPNDAGSEGEIPFVILGMGRLGLNEFDLASDADLVFVVDAEVKREDLERCTQRAEKTIEVLSSYTRDGTVFPVDTRLRPRGHEGELVVSLDSLVTYIAEDAKAWELLTYLKVQALAGHPRLAESAVNRVQAAINDRFSTYQDFEGQLHQMRRRLEREVTVPASNTKTAPGGYYDVDFAVSYVRLQGRVMAAPGANMAQQIAALRKAGVISTDDAASLTEGADFLRSVDHLLRLMTGKPPSGLPENSQLAELAEAHARRWGLISEAQTLPTRLREIQQQLRYVYRRLVGAE